MDKRGSNWPEVILLDEPGRDPYPFDVRKMESYLRKKKECLFPTTEMWKERRKIFRWSKRESPSLLQLTFDCCSDLYVYNFGCVHSMSGIRGDLFNCLAWYFGRTFFFLKQVIFGLSMFGHSGPWLVDLYTWKKRSNYYVRNNKMKL